MADIIYFKDGMRTVCQGKAWEEKNEVKCDHDGVILTYRKEDVDQIHKTIITEETAHTEEAAAPPESKSISPEAAVKDTVRLEPAPNMVGSGIPFYDPRRQFKYWSSTTAKHRNYKDAINALAEEFGQSPQWIETHIGDSNDLVLIRKNLASPAKTVDKVVAPSSAAIGTPSHDLFYNPRREYKYQISAKKKFHTYKEAINALAFEFGTTPQWVEEHMGQENDILLIRQNLNREKLNPTE